MARYLSGNEGSSTRVRSSYRHTPYQIEKLEEFFQTNQHPSDALRSIISRDLGLTEKQTKFWFQNRRTFAKAQAEKDECIALREENEKLRIENMSIQRVLRSAYCSKCHPGQELHNHLQQLRSDNHRINTEYGKMCKYVASSGPMQQINILRELLATRMIGNNEQVFPCKLQQAILKNDDIEVVKIVAEATAELTSLFALDTLWKRDPSDKKISINRSNYRNFISSLFPMNRMKNHFPNDENLGYHFQFESSKEQATIKMNAPELIQILMHPAKKHLLFPTLITNTRTMRQMDISTGIELVYEQVHLPTQMVSPRDFYVLRYIDQVTERSWMIVETSYEGYNFFMDKAAAASKNPYGSLQWKLPSGCFIQELGNGYSKVTWIEHVQVNDRIQNDLYRDLILGGFAYGAEKWIYTLQRMCLRMECEREGNYSKGAKGSAESMRNMMKLTQGMVTKLCETLAMKKYHISYGGNGIETSDALLINVSRQRLGQGDGMIVLCLTTSFQLPLTPEDVFSFLTDIQMRDKWDFLCSEDASTEVANISYGNSNQSCISIIQPLNPYEKNIMILQESFFDPERATIAYTPINKPSLDTALLFGESSILNVLPSGFIISSNGRPITSSRIGASTSSSSTKPASGSLITMVYQVVDRNCDGTVDFHSLTQTTLKSARSMVSSTIRRIKDAFNIE